MLEVDEDETPPRPARRLCSKRWNAEAWLDRLTTNGAINQPFALSLSKGNSHDRATSGAKPREGDRHLGVTQLVHAN